MNWSQFVQCQMIPALVLNRSEHVLGAPVRILAVDDDPIMREFAATQLLVPGGSVVTASDGEEAWSILESDPEGFDLIVSDLEMPRLDGFGLATRIREDRRWKHLPIVVITSRDDMFAIDRAYEVGATSFVTKPVNWRLLGYQLRYVLRSSQLEAEIRRARDEAEQAAELRRNLLTLLQHETRTPLNAIIGYAQILHQSLPDNLSRDLPIETVVKAARNLNDVLGRVFFFGQTIAGTLPLDREVLRLDHVIEEAACVLRARFSHLAGAVVVSDRGGGPIPVDVDMRHLSTALVEIVGNALTHGSGGSPVEICLLPGDRDAVIEVRDQGPGMPAGMIDRLSQAFAQGNDPLTRSCEGLGLGLPTAQRLVELHGGVLQLTSRPEQGTCVRIVLPRAVPEARRASA